MKRILARSHYGGRDLYLGVPNLVGAVFLGSRPIEEKDDYATLLEFRLASGETFELVIKQEKV